MLQEIIKNTLSLTHSILSEVVNDGRDFPTIYADSAAIPQFRTNNGKSTKCKCVLASPTGLTIEQIHSALGDILTDTIGGYWEVLGG